MEKVVRETEFGKMIYIIKNGTIVNKIYKVSIWKKLVWILKKLFRL
jgi:hypothetical protein